ncbi:WD40 repeat-like protein [Mycena venus]|uniref:WD40 repeat-like protein n=1 Tax=Mycena venus TaxID=2733690 RepID=A0A8H6YMC3_9AGAR|nr:WD40 repeat-like protein [Mycena venus]
MPGASEVVFFFKRGHTTRGNANALFVTLAYQLAVHDQILKPLIWRSVKDDPSVVGRHMDVQLRDLIIRPCHSLNRHSALPVLLIDGLDECDDHNVQQEILRLIEDAVREHPRMLKILIASRPESHISEVFHGTMLRGLCRGFDINQSFADVEKYLLAEFARIHREHHETMQNAPTPWPSCEVISTLVSRSSGYFMYAATVIKFIDDKDFRPTERLATVVQNLSTTVARPFAALDHLYIQIFSSIPDRSRLLPILCVIINFRSSSKDIEQLLGLDPGDVRLALRRLHSVLQVPPNDFDDISVYHASFRDFLGDETRSGEFCLGTLERRLELARSGLKSMSYLYDASSGRRRSDTKHVAWKHGIDIINYLVSSIPPSADLLPLIRSVNPEFFWRAQDSVMMQRMVDWLRKIEPISATEDLVCLWEDYNLLNFYDWIFHRYSDMKHPPADTDAQKCHQLFSQYPQLLRVIQAWWICRIDFDPLVTQSPSLFYIRLLLDIPWDEMRMLIRPLHSLKVNSVQSGALLFSANAIVRCPTICRDLSRGCIRLFKGIETEVLPLQLWLHGIQWGRLIGSAPICPELLQELRDLEPPTIRPSIMPRSVYGPRQFRYLLVWLKSFPEPPLDIISRWETYEKAAYTSLLGGTRIESKIFPPPSGQHIGPVHADRMPDTSPSGGANRAILSYHVPIRSKGQDPVILCPEALG